MTSAVDLLSSMNRIFFGDRTGTVSDLVTLLTVELGTLSNGNRTVNVDPLPVPSLWAVIIPCISWANAWEILNPKPSPNSNNYFRCISQKILLPPNWWTTSGPPCWNVLKILPIWLGLIPKEFSQKIRNFKNSGPIPRSITVINIEFGVSLSVNIVNWLFSGLNLILFFIIFQKICCNLEWSAAIIKFTAFKRRSTEICFVYRSGFTNSNVCWSSWWRLAGIISSTNLLFIILVMSNKSKKNDKIIEFKVTNYHQLI